MIWRTDPSRPKPANTCPQCGSAGFAVSVPGSRPVYRCFSCKKEFGLGVPK